MTRAPRGDGVTCVTGCQFSRRKKRKINKKLKRNIVDHVGTGFTHSVPLTKVEELVDTSKDAMVVNLSVSSVAENSSSENVVLRSLLRGPRYFDPPDESWGACFNCGEEGHSTVNCTSARGKKPCFICGSLEHEVKQCQKGQDCFLCKEKGHRAKDCPQKMKRCSLVSDFCLRCGASAHVMNSCNNDYPPDDLKDIQCYVCKRFGHLCCTNYCDVFASEASCHKCGHTGHYVQDCTGSRGGMSAGGTPSSCFKRGEGGHLAHEYKTSGKAKKRTRDSSTPAGKKCPQNKKVNKGHKSAPQDLGKTRKKLHLKDRSPNWSSKHKRRGGWIQDDSGDLPPRNNWRSPSTPNKNHRVFDMTAGGQGSKRRGGWIQDDSGDLPPRNNWRSASAPNKNHRIFDLTAGGQGSSPQSYRKKSNFSPGSSSRGYGAAYEHRYTTSRFGHPTHHTNTKGNYNLW